MILDGNLILTGTVSAAGVIAGQAISSGAGTYLGFNVVDNAPLALGGNQPGDVGAGEPLEVEFSVTGAATAGTSVRFQLIEADDAAMSVNVNVIVQTDDIPIANLPTGTIVPLHYDRAAPYIPRRYTAVRFIAVGAIANFFVFASIVKNLQDIKNLYYKSGFSVV